MNDSLEFPKALYHPKTGEMATVLNADQESEKLEEWGVNDAPKIPLKAETPKAAPKPRAAKGASKAKAAN